jgi:multicomponent Na+:H+ antiporter subunit E
MVEAARQPARGTRETCYLFVFLFATWLFLTSSFHWQELLTGALISVILSAFLGWTYARLGLPPFTPRRLWYFGVYLVVLFKEIVRANLDVAYRVIHPRLPIKPGIVAIRTELTQDIAKMLLANSITLTPGTFTLDILGDTLLIHWIDVRSEDMEEAAALISGRFERYLREIFA